MKANKYLVSGISLTMLIATTLTGCGNVESATTTSSEQQVITTSVETQTLSTEPIQAYKTISSNILAENEVNVVPKVGGTISKVYVKVGDSVKAGDLLFEIDSKDLQLQVKSAQNSVSSAQSSVSSAQAGLNSAQANSEMNTGSKFDSQISSQKSNIENLERQYNDLLKDLESNQALLEIGAISQNAIDSLETQIATTKTNLEQAKEQLKILEEKTIAETKRVSDASVKQAQASVLQAQAQVQQSQISLENAQQQLSYTQVKAEVDGIINTCNITEGATAAAGNPAISIIGMDHVKISFNVTGDIINNIHVGDKVYSYVDAVSTEPFEGVISTIAPGANSQTGLYPVEINIQNPKHLLRPGMFAISKLVLKENKSALTVPINAVLEKDNQKYIFTVDENNIAHKVAVETGIENDTHIEITSGATQNDQIVIKGQDYLSDGSLVTVVASN